MSGIYIHIPFCSKACHYCNFHFSTSLQYKDDMILAILKEIDARHSYLDDKKIKSIYFGGGTPTLLTGNELNLITEKLAKYFDFSELEECTIEANPDDLKLEYIYSLKNTIINRLSIGVQSFHESELKWMNRSHNVSQSDGSIKMAQDNGFENISIDLIYGVPDSTEASWNYNLEKLKEFDINHLSSYCLTVEPKTPLAKKIVRKELKSPDEEMATKQFEILVKSSKEMGYEHYEISNFAKNGAFALHNTSYWKSIPYLGLGPSAHSYDGDNRQWNIANNGKYMTGLNENKEYFEKEILTESEKYNEMVLTRLRTMWGIQLKDLSKFEINIQNHFKLNIQRMVEKELVSENESIFSLTNAGKKFADMVAMELFI
jgi:oxygen-independent coproporphyrinogen III oxidase